MRLIHLSLPTLIISNALATESSPLAPIEVSTKKEASVVKVSEEKISNNSDTVQKLLSVPGISTQTGGGVASLPVMHGMVSDRINIKVDGAQITPACPNHMNPALSYFDPGKLEEMEVMTGITPVSEGGDSIAGSIVVRSKKIDFAKEGEFNKRLSLGSFYRSNNVNRGGSLDLGLTSSKYSFEYNGFQEEANRYTTGEGDTLKGTIYNQNNQAIVLGSKIGQGELKLKASRAIVPYQGFINQYMDMSDNKSDLVNLGYVGEVNRVMFETNLYNQFTTHFMDKLSSERTGSMPMYTRAVENGYNIKANFELTSNVEVKFGSDYNQYRLEDWWTPVTTTPSGMGPNEFRSVHNGVRDRFGIFIESTYQISEKIKTQFGVRGDIVKMDAGDVQGYNNGGMMANAPADQNSFNAKDRNKTDRNWDLTLGGTYQMNGISKVDLGYSRKTRSPNLYERYAWAGSVTDPSTSMPVAMDMRMINWFGDGNGYVGDIGLSPEVAHTVSLGFDLSDSLNHDWNLNIKPYFTYIEDYIDADLLGTSNSNINYLKFANHDSVIYGLDLVAYKQIFNSEQGGLKVKTLVNYNRGYRKDGKNSLHHVMPLNNRTGIEYDYGKYSLSLLNHLVDEKSQVNKQRREPNTAGYALFDFGARVQATKFLQFNFSITNLLDKAYAQPLGGIDVVNAGGGAAQPVVAMGRSFNTSLKMDF